MNSEFAKSVISAVRAIPKGKVVSYGQIAAKIGSPRAARQVGTILRHSELGSLPWWRVVNNQGYISIKGNFTANAQMQKELLENEGVEVSKNYTLDIKKYRHSL